MKDELRPNKTVVYALTEKTVKSASVDESLEGGTNAYIYALEQGKIFKQNKLSPIYLYDEENSAIYVTSKEHIKKMFH